MSHEAAMPERRQSTTRAIWGFDGIRGRNVPKAFVQRLTGCSDSHGAVPKAKQHVRDARQTGPEIQGIGAGSLGVRFAIAASP